MTTLERASRYVAALPAAISGYRGHDALFQVVCVLVNGFALSDLEAWPILLEYNARCLPPWSERELRHKLCEARKVSHLHPRGHLLADPKEIALARVPGPPRVLGRITLSELPAVTEGKQSAAPAPDGTEARRIATELVELHRDGAISGADEPEARFYARLIHVFGATYNGRGES